MKAREPLKCPVCHKILGEAFWVAQVVSLIVHCRCKRVLEIREDYSARVLQEQQPTSR